MGKHRAFIVSIGGYQKAARRLRKNGSTVHAWMSADDGKLPADFEFQREATEAA